MHGNPIGQADLETELTTRETLITPLLGFWEQISDWRLVVFDNIVFENGRIVYVGTQLHGENPSSIELSSTTWIESDSSQKQVKKHVVYLINLNNIHQRYQVSPLLIGIQSYATTLSYLFKSITRGKEH